MTTWDSPDSDPIGDIRRQMELFRQQRVLLPSVTLLPEPIARIVEWERRKTRINLDWNAFVAPRLTGVQRFLRRRWWDWKYRNEGCW